MTLIPELPASPCVRRCYLSPDHLCLGCYRTLEEIAGWSKMAPSARKAILTQIEKRRPPYAKADQ